MTTPTGPKLSPELSRWPRARTVEVILTHAERLWGRVLALTAALVIGCSGPMTEMLKEGHVETWGDLMRIGVMWPLLTVAAGVVSAWVSRGPQDVSKAPRVRAKR